MQCWSNKTLLLYSQHEKIHKLIHSADVKISWTKWTRPFWPGPPKNHWNNFLLFCICTNMQKISSFHQFLSTGFVIWIGILCFLQCKRDKNIHRFNLIVLHLCDNDFMFYFDICIKFRLSTTISTMKQW